MSNLHAHIDKLNRFQSLLMKAIQRSDPRDKFAIEIDQIGIPCIHRIRSPKGAIQTWELQEIRTVVSKWQWDLENTNKNLTKWEMMFLNFAYKTLHTHMKFSLPKPSISEISDNIRKASKRIFDNHIDWFSTKPIDYLNSIQK